MVGKNKQNTGVIHAGFIYSKLARLNKIKRPLNIIAQTY